MIRKPLVSLVLLVLCVCIFCSCNSTQMKERSIVEAVAIDFKNGMYQLSLKEHATDNDTEARIIISDGRTLFEALKNAESNDGKQIFYGHSGVFIIGVQAANRGMQQIFEFMNSNYQISLNSAVLVADGRADEILKSEDFLNSDADFSIKRIQDCGKSVDVTVIDALKTSYNLSGNFYLPIISNDNQNGLRIENCVVFKDNKPNLILNERETMGLNLINSDVKDGVFITKNKGQNISVDIVSEKTDISITLDGNNPILNIDVYAYGNISEMGVIGDEDMRKNHLMSVEKDVEDEIKENIEALLEKAVLENKCDIFYIKQRIKSKDKQYYENIKENETEEILGGLKFRVSADFTVRHSGIQVK